MKQILIPLVFLILLSGCSMNRYLLTDDKEYLIGVIKEMAKDGQISKKPLVVLDLVPYIYQKKLKENRLPISKTMIDEFWSLEKYAGEAIYGTIAEGGVLVINTKQFLTTVNNKTYYNKILFLLETHKKSYDDKILILLDDRKILKEELDALNLNELESIRLVKDTGTIGKYSAEGFNKIFILTK